MHTLASFVDHLKGALNWVDFISNSFLIYHSTEELSIIVQRNYIIFAYGPEHAGHFECLPVCWYLFQLVTVYYV